MSVKKQSYEMLPPNQMAQLLVMSEQDLANLTKNGVLRRSTERKGGRHRVVYEWRECVRSYILHLRKPFEDAREQFIVEKAETQRIIRAHKEIELAKARGEMIARSHVIAVVGSLLITVKQHVLAIPSRCSRLLLGLTTVRDIHSLLSKNCELTLREANEFDVEQFGRNGTNGKHDLKARRAKARKRSARR